MKFLIDECLSPMLATRARDRGHGESTHVVWRRWAGLKDWELISRILDGDWTFVTRNASDFRGPTNAPGSKGQYADVALHAGLICLDAEGEMDLALQLRLFDDALDTLARDSDLVNRVLEITWEAGTIYGRRYRLPPDEA